MEEKAPIKVSDMVRQTVDNSHHFYMQIAEHIDNLEFKIEMLTGRIEELTKLSNGEIDDLK
jgi:hypothetical protein